MATRSHVREVVVQLLYAYSSGNDAIFKFADEIFEEHKIKNKQKDFANLLFNGVIENLESLDLRIAHQLESWDFSKIGDMEKAILRLGVYEIAFNNLDKAIAINEALELAKTFGNEASAKFINGVLDNIAKNLQIPIHTIQESMQKAKQATSDLAKPEKSESKTPKAKNQNSTKKGKV
ncbi:transcription antitermination factor NusB [Helicobacter sp. CaF467b]|uniref:transcription antitermination factor NusB n=1 Tax=Helicobacter sp. CaF467b TaxID=2919923 RepID=UPI003221BB56